MSNGIEFQTYGTNTLKVRLPMDVLLFLWMVELEEICQMTSANVEEHRVL